MDRSQLRAANKTGREILELSKRAYIGRTNFPERRLLQHMASAGRNKLFSVCWCDSDSEAVTVEESLLAEFGDLLKVENAALDSRGRWGEPPHAVYVSWVWRVGVPQETNISGLSAKLVDEVPLLPGRSRFLRTTLDR